MMLREALQDVLADEDPESLRWWATWARRARLEPFRKLADSIVKHWDGIWIFAFFLVPETKGKTLEKIEAHWRAGKQPRAL